MYNEFIDEVNRDFGIIKSELKKLTQHQVENKVIPMIKNITGIDDINTRTNFFDLGMTSIQTVQLKVTLEEAFMEKVDDVALFKHTNVNELAEYICTDILKSDHIVTTKEEAGNVNSAKSRMSKLLKSAVSH